MKSFQQKLGYQFNTIALLEQALTHPSFYSSHKKKLSINHFERYEFIGDRVLGVCVGDMLFHTFKSACEGELSRRLGHLVCKETLADVANEMGIPGVLNYARANDNNPAQWITFLSDACEAVIGAVYLDGGLPAARHVIELFWSPLMHKTELSIKDPKTQLQEYVQMRFKVLPQYEIIQKVGSSHAPEITVECRVKALTVTAKGSSKKSAANICAQLMLEKLQKD